MGENSEMDKINLAFNQLATKEQKTLLFLLEEEKNNRSACTKTIVDYLSLFKEKVGGTIYKLE
ncbi:MAG: hypothetical protein ACFFAN_01515, partial [Promethearchaeota archaeon]